MTQMTRMKKRILYLAGFWLALIFVTSCFVIPFDTFVHFVQGLSSNIGFKEWFAQFWLVSWFFVVKGWHATEYAILVWIVATALQNVKRWNRRQSVGAAFGFAVLFAFSDEWHQTFLLSRTGAFRDVILDRTAGLVAQTAIFTMQRTLVSHD